MVGSGNGKRGVVGKKSEVKRDILPLVSVITCLVSLKLKKNVKRKKGGWWKRSMNSGKRERGVMRMNVGVLVKKPDSQEFERGSKKRRGGRSREWRR